MPSPPRLIPRTRWFCQFYVARRDWVWRLRPKRPQGGRCDCLLFWGPLTLGRIREGVLS